MTDDSRREAEPGAVRTGKPGDRVPRVRTRHARLPVIERRFGALREPAGLLADIATQTTVPWMIGALGLLVALDLAAPQAAVSRHDQLLPTAHR